MKDTPVDLQAKEAYFCFGMSKMTMIHDVGEDHNNYFRMR